MQATSIVHLLLAASLQWDPFGFFSWFQLMFILTFVFSIIFTVAIFGLIAYVICRATKARELDSISEQSTFDLTTLPRRRRKILREILPRECPECGASLKYNEVRWTGPHQAECPYCGHTVELQIVEV